jgi:hypothetical protein
MAGRVDDRTLLFLHIQKTGGSSLRYILERQYPSSQILKLSIGAVRRIETLPERQRRAARLVLGHFDYGFHTYFRKPSTYVTMLRDPVERAISNYFRILENEKHAYHDRVLSETRSIIEYMESGIDPIVDNGMTQKLAGKTAPYGRVPSEYLAMAKSNLDTSFSVVGITEKFDESLLLLRQAFGWGNVCYVRRNVTGPAPPRQGISEADLEAVRRHNILDAALYAYARKRLEAIVERQGDQFQASLARFRTINRLYAILYMLLHPVVDRVRAGAAGRSG